MQKARFVSRSNFHLKQCRLASHNAESQIIAKLSLTLSIDGVALYSLVVCSFVRPSAWWHHHLSPPYDVLDHTNHIFSESLSSGDDNDQDKDLQKDKYKDTHTDKDKYKVLPRPNVCYIFPKQGVQGFKILYWLSSFDDKDKDMVDIDMVDMDMVDMDNGHDGHGTLSSFIFWCFLGHWWQWWWYNTCRE